MARLTFIKNHMTENRALYRHGLTYVVDDTLVDSLIADRVAYFEGEEPPFAAEDIEAMNMVSNRVAALKQATAEKQAARFSTLAARKDYEEAVALEAKARAAALLETRRRAKKPPTPPTPPAPQGGNE